MKPVQAGLATLRRVGRLLSESTDPSPQSGVWTTHVTREAIIANVMLSVGLVAVLALVWFGTGRPVLLLAALILLVAAKVISLSGQAVALVLDKHPGEPPSNRTFQHWAMLTALIGLPLAHLVLAVAPEAQPLARIPSLKKFFPEFFLLILLAVRYWRLMIVRLWFERLGAEKLKRQSAEQARALAETRLHMLEAQIEPQFLFSTLANVQQLVRTDTTEADRLLVQLVSYLRQAIPDVRGSASTLGRELELARTYLAIVQVRIGERLTVSVACDPALEKTPLPSLVIHTLLDNAVRHGIDNKPGPVAIAVRAQRVQTHIEIEIEDSGAGLGAGTAVGPGLGLRNVRDRLELAYRGQARLDVAERDSGGVRVTVRIPA